jgi:hypothetical protein
MAGTSGFKGSGITDPFQTPDAPTVDSVSAGVLSADVTISAPADTGGAAIDSYVVTAKQGDGTSVTGTASAAGTVSLTLTAGGTTTFAAQALNKYGAGQFSGLGNSTTVFSGQELYSWGRNLIGELGLSDQVTRSSPVQIGSLTNWSSASAGNRSSFAITTSGELYSWGNNGLGQLGLNIAGPDQSSPVQVGSLTNWSSVGSGHIHTMAVKSDGTLWGWGDAERGILGNNSQIDKSSPVQIGSDTDWSFAEGGQYDTVALKTDGTAWAWGNNTGGNLGQNNTIRRSSPVQIGSETDWTSISVSSSVLGVRGGELYAWGGNLSGELGDGTRVDRSSPVQIGALTNWSKVSTGSSFSLALKQDGTLWAWGNNFAGKLGININQAVDKSSPVQIGTDTDWSDLVAAETGNHGIAVKSSGEIYSWGYNLDGQLGLGDTVHRSSPVQIGSVTGWLSLAAGPDHTLAAIGTTS